ncbi:hypothetical protein B566_EDAN001819 [Ephemera danica]|nr:hypothetical protein B566_EDAN001819 [Ephemera danica]
MASEKKSGLIGRSDCVVIILQWVLQSSKQIALGACASGGPQDYEEEEIGNERYLWCDLGAICGILIIYFIDVKLARLRIKQH